MLFVLMEILQSLRSFRMTGVFMNHDQFSEILEWPVFAGELDGAQAVAVAVSGGADSMALLLLLAEWARGRDVAVHVLTVDHGLRAEAAVEADQVAAWCAGLDGVSHHILRWEGEKPEVALQEHARAARYGLMEAYCAAQGIGALFLAHHRDDQAETVLFRLAKGSGLKGLGGMRPVARRGDVVLMRPLLDVTKEDLIAVCEARGQDYVSDPSNEDEAFARVRLRQSMAVLAEEGLTAKRLSVTAMRLARAEDALEVMVDGVWSEVLIKNSGSVVLKIGLLQGQPEEIAVRLIICVIERLGAERDYLPRMKKIEDLVAALRCDNDFRKRTLGGLIFERDAAAGEIIISCE